VVADDHVISFPVATGRVFAGLLLGGAAGLFSPVLLPCAAIAGPVNNAQNAFLKTAEH